MDYNTGHRALIKERLLNSKVGVLKDYEVMELLLCLALPRIDTKPLAKILIEKYGSFAKAISAEEQDLLSMKGVGISVITCFKLIKEGSLRLAKEEIRNKPVISSWQSLLDYCRILLGHLTKEACIVLYLNGQNELIDEDLQIDGTVDQVVIYPREIAKRALFLNASAVILAHNHPSGSIKASKADIDVTQNIKLALEPFEIKIHDHVIISDKGFFSFKTEGLL